MDDPSPDYSQFGEQRLIQRFLAQRREPVVRYCVDVGAFDGDVGSNSRALFAAGWSGIAIEPNPRSFARLQRLYAGRTDVLCLQVAVSDRDERDVPMLFSIGPADVPADDRWQYGQVSTLNEAFAEEYRRDHGYRYETACVGVVTLTGLLDRQGAPRHFGLLSIDCEGEDVRVLRAFDLRRYRPALICVECDDAHRALFAGVLGPHGYAAVAHTVSNTLFAPS